MNILATHRRGSITALAAAGISILIGVTALMVDLGSVTLESRRLQGIADAAAMAAAGNLASAQISANAALTASGSRLSMTAVVTTGVYTPDPAIAAAARFVAGGSQSNAARVKVTARAPLFRSRLGHLIRHNLAQRDRRAQGSRQFLDRRTPGFAQRWSDQPNC